MVTTKPSISSNKRLKSDSDFYIESGHDTI